MSKLEQTYTHSSGPQVHQWAKRVCKWVKGSSFVSCGVHSASSLFTSPPYDLHVLVFIYSTLHTRSHLPFHDNDGKQEGQWQLLVFAQVVRVCVIARFDSEMFAKGRAPLQRHASLPKTPRLHK